MSIWMSHLSSMFERRFRGVRLIELVGIALALMMIVWICLSKVREGEDVKRLNALNAEIGEQSGEVNDLRMAVSHLERPERLEALAGSVLKMGSVDHAHEADMDTLAEISHTGSQAERPAQAHPAPAPQPAAKVDLPIEASAQVAKAAEVKAAAAHRPLEIDVAPAKVVKASAQKAPAQKTPVKGVHQ